MGRVQDLAGEGWDREDVSPDGRLAIDTRPYPDPRSQFEINYPEQMALRDLTTGEAALELGYAPLETHRWTDDGGVELDFEKGLSVRVAPDLKTFTGNADGGAVHPIGALGLWLSRNRPPSPPAAMAEPTPRPKGQRAVELTIAALLLIFALVVALW
jgi:hypothetical protein